VAFQLGRAADGRIAIAMQKLIPIIFLIFAIPCFAQNDSQPMLVDEFGPIQCDEFLAHVDSLYIQINNNPGSEGYFVTSGGNQFLSKKLYFELLFESGVKQRGYDTTRSTLIRGMETGPFNVKVWLVKAGGKKTDVLETKWDLRISPGDEPFLLRSDMAQICDPPPIGRVAADLLDANADGSIFVVVHGPTTRQRGVELRRARKMLSWFDPARVRYLLRHSGTPYSDYYFATGKPKRTAFKSSF
jgi:hypothetical protein